MSVTGSKTYLMRIRPQRHTECSCQTEIAKLQVAVAIDEQVLRLQIPMQNSVTVAVPHALDQLCHELLHHILSHAQSL